MLGDEDAGARAARIQAEQAAKAEADRLAKEEADRKAKEEADRKAKEEAAKNATKETEAERIARLAREESARQFAATQRAASEAQAKRRDDAFSRITALMNKAGLGGLEANVKDLIARDIIDTDLIFLNLRDTPQYKTRFAGNAAREAKGLAPLDPASYIALEQSYASTLRFNRLPSGFYDQPDDFKRFIENDISVAELQSRIEAGFAKVREADPQVLNTLRRFYPEVGQTEEALAAYFLDPERGLSAVKRQVAAAQVGARAAEQGGLTIGAGTAEELVSRGFTEEEAQAAFTKMSRLQGLYQEMGTEERLSAEQKLGAAFGYDVAATAALEARRATRVAEFQQGGGFTTTRGATSGVTETGLASAQ